MPTKALVVQVAACPTTRELLEVYRSADPRADLVELRLDLVRDLDLEAILSARGKPKLVTVRSREQGGQSRPAEREPILRKALESGVEYLDLELTDSDRPLLKGRPRTRRILSHHDLVTTPADLQELHARMRAVGEGALIKIVTFADAATDLLRIRDLLRGAEHGALAAFAMGPKGVPSRILASHWGSAAIYAPRRGDPASAPGQVPLEDLFDLYRFDRIGPGTRLLGLLGSPVDHSLSPRMHNAALGSLEIDARYLPFEATTLAEFLPVMSELRVSGVSVTLPHKQRFLAHVDHLEEQARSVGAINTVVKTWNRLEGYNTDVDAALAPLRALRSLDGARVALLGAGGAARALVYGLTKAGARVTIFNRTPSRAGDLAREFGARHLPWSRLRRFPCDILVNSTSVGLAPDQERSPLPAAWIGAPLVYDIIYNPPETALLRQARARGARVLGGVEMFVAQGAAQFRLFTGREAPVDLMRRVVLEALQSAPVPSHARAAPRRASVRRKQRPRSPRRLTGRRR